MVRPSSRASTTSTPVTKKKASARRGWALSSGRSSPWLSASATAARAAVSGWSGSSSRPRAQAVKTQPAPASTPHSTGWPSQTFCSTKAATAKARHSPATKRLDG